jgi:hypothetical protein
MENKTQSPHLRTHNTTNSDPPKSPLDITLLTLSLKYPNGDSKPLIPQKSPIPLQPSSRNAGKILCPINNMTG